MREPIAGPLAMAALLLAAVHVEAPAQAASSDAGVPLTVCADPADLPYSNRAQEGFENRIAALIAQQLHHPLRYDWWPQTRGFTRKTLGAARCDVWLGVAHDMSHVASTHAYYRSTYVFVTRREDPLAHLSLDDARLRSRRIGVEVLGGGGPTPAAHALAERGLVTNVRGFLVTGIDSPPLNNSLLDALVAHEIDVALLWGPKAGFYARHSAAALRIEPVTPDDDPAAPMTYAIAMAVRREEPQLRHDIDEQLERQRTQIRAILDDYGVPQLPLESLRPGS